LAYQALYRKYRPTTFCDVYGQEHITDTLKHEVETNKTVHAYLFTGTRGTGKTTCAKILAKAVNCLNPVNGDPCGECEICKAIAEEKVTDICEIDAASNNGVDDIRTLREQVNFAPATAKYRVYIIDEVHMLSQSAFNALLKTLEEPPEHIIFILATTEVHKLPATILSRCQRFDFRRISPEKITERIKFVANSEGFSVTDEAATLIASTADGGMRDALSILDLCASKSKEITEDTVVSVCAMASNDYLLKLAEYIKTKNASDALSLLDELHNSSVDMVRLLNELTVHFRDLMIAKTVKDKRLPIVCSTEKLEKIKEQAKSYDLGEILSILEFLQNTAGKMQSGANGRTEMEMTLIRLCNPEVANDISALEMRISALESKLKFGTPLKEIPKKAEEQPKPIKEKPEKAIETVEEPPEEEPLPEPPVEEDFPVPVAVTSGENAPIVEWEDVLSILRRTCPLIAGVLQGSSAYIDGDLLLIATENEQFKTLVNSDNPIYRNSIRKAASEVLGKTFKLGPYKPSDDNAPKNDPLADLNNRLKTLGN